MLNICMNNRSAASLGIDESLEQLAADLSTHTIASSHEQARQNCNGNDGKSEKFGGGHDRRLVMVIGGRIGTMRRRIGRACDLAYTCAKKLWDRLIEDEVCGRSCGYWLR